MALYAFDGTWNTDKPGTENDTNVLWFREAYKGPCFYRQGVGTRFGPFGHVLGGMTGAGGRSRVEEALIQLALNVSNGDDVVDVVGFSRGAALALHFCNQVEQQHPGLAIRFLGLWDCVPSFGAPSIDLNLGWDLDLPDNVVKCYHALALDERRHTFQLHRLNARVVDADQPGRLFEVWFRGVHSDVGGGNSNPGLSSIPLNWMLLKAKSCGLDLDGDKLTANKARMKPDSPQSTGQWYDFIKNKWRAVRWNDFAHESVSFRKEANNPPVGLCMQNDDGDEVRKFAHA